MRLTTIKEVSSILCVKVSTLYSWVHKGSIPYRKLNGLVRFDMEAIREWVNHSKPTLSKTTATLREKKRLDIDRIIKKAVDSVTPKEYNLSNGKPGQTQGLRKEV